MSDQSPAPKGGITPLRITIWILGAAIAIALIVVGVVGILTKAR
jgi:hypothetical protein